MRITNSAHESVAVAPHIAHFRNSATGHGYIATLILRTAPLLPSREGSVAKYWHFDW